MATLMTAKSFEAQLEGALHVKEQEAIIAEVHQWLSVTERELSDGNRAGNLKCMTIETEFPWQFPARLPSRIPDSVTRWLHISARRSAKQF